MTRSDMIVDLVTTFQNLLAAKTEEELARIYDKKDDLLQQVGTLVTKLATPAPPAPPAHEDIRITFVSGDGKRTYEAVGFLKEGETSVNGDTMLERTASKNGGAIKDDDWDYLREHGFQPNPELEKYYLATDRRNPDNPRSVSYFFRYDDVWGEDWHDLGRQWHRLGLVVRRLT